MFLLLFFSNGFSKSLTTLYGPLIGWGSRILDLSSYLIFLCFFFRFMKMISSHVQSSRPLNYRTPTISMMLQVKIHKTLRLSPKQKIFTVIKFTFKARGEQNAHLWYNLTFLGHLYPNDLVSVLFSSQLTADQHIFMYHWCITFSLFD